jgi:membrane-bound lytic murein transglycosylase D
MRGRIGNVLGIAALVAGAAPVVGGASVCVSDAAGIGAEAPPTCPSALQNHAGGPSGPIPFNSTTFTGTGIGDKSPPTLEFAVETYPALRRDALRPLGEPKPVGPANLIDRIRAGMVLPVPDQRRVRQELAWYSRHPDYLDRVLTRASAYLPHIVAEIHRRGLPMELALLPVVESAYDPFAYSHGRAAGLWQIIPGTGRRFGLKQNWWYDGRRDVVESTRAALDYLEYLHDFFDGDWEHAVAAYNSGEGNVRRAIRRNRAAGKPTDFWNLRLPRETSAYVPRLLALSKLVADPDAHGITLPAVPDEPRFEVVEIGSQLDLALAAELAGIDIDELYAYNPGLNRWATDPAGPHRLTVPVEAVEAFRERLAGVPVAERVRWKRHKVANGQTLSEIAELHGTTLGAIRRANGLNGNLIRAGSHLLIPVATRPLSAYSLSADARLAKQQERQSGAGTVEHVVRRGESFWTISRKYGVGVRELAKWNGLAPGDTLSVGRRLVVHNASVREAPTPAASIEGKVRKVRYTVRRGDSLSLIASRFRVTVRDITRWNSLDPAKILRPGDKITMYVDVTAQSS